MMHRQTPWDANTYGKWWRNPRPLCLRNLMVSSFAGPKTACQQHRTIWSFEDDSPLAWSDSPWPWGMPGIACHKLVYQGQWLAFTNGAITHWPTQYSTWFTHLALVFLFPVSRDRKRPKPDRTRTDLDWTAVSGLTRSKGSPVLGPGIFWKKKDRKRPV